MENPINIVEGFTNLAKKKFGIADSEIEMLAVLRERICNECVVDGNAILSEGRCTKCGCVMQAKWRALNSKCPLGKW